jgi:hypothetical protein
MKSVSLPPNSTLHQRVLTLIKDRKTASKNLVQKNFRDWDRAEDLYRAWRIEDTDDRESQAEHGVSKLVVPVSFAQVQTQLTFLLATFTQRDPIFPVPPRNIEHARAAEASELVLDAQMDQAKIFVRLYLALRDALVLGRMVLHTDYLKQVQRITKVAKKIKKIEFFGTPVSIEGKEDRSDFETLFEGNKVNVINPREFWHDPGVTLTDLQEGEFAGHTSFTNLVTFLRTVDAFDGSPDNPYINIEEARKSSPAQAQFPDKGTEDSSHYSRTSNHLLKTIDKHSKPMVIDQVVIDLIPSDLKDDKGRVLSNSKWPQKWTFWLVNDAIVVRAHPQENDHRMFPYAAAEPYPDSHHIATPGMVDMLSGLQEHFDWLLNSHWANVRRAIQNKLIVDPSRVVMADVLSSDPAGIIRMKPEAYGDPVGDAIQQLPIMDVTGRHIEDSRIVMDLMQRVGATSDNQQGIPEAGRRSATEISSTQRLGAGRGKTLAQLLWFNALAPMVMQMVMNNRQFMTEEIYVNTLGRKLKFFTPEEVKFLMGDEEGGLNVGPADVQGRYLFPAFEGDIPSEQSSQARMLLETIKTVLSVPGLAQVFDIQKMVIEGFRKSGLRSPEDYIRMQGPPPTQMLFPDGQRGAVGGGAGPSGPQNTGSGADQVTGNKEVRPPVDVGANNGIG